MLEAINLIDFFLQQSLAGDTVEIDSGDFENVGLRIEDQTNILDALQDDYECIKYTYVRPNKEQKVDSLPWKLNQHYYRLAQISDIDPLYFQGKALSHRDYTIRVLSDFTDVKKKAEADELSRKAYHAGVLSDTPRDTSLEEHQRSTFVYATMRRNQIMVATRAGISVPLGKPLQYGRAPYNFMRYMEKNAFKGVNIHDIREEVEGCKGKTDLTELVRNCHFDKYFKKIFFERTTTTIVRFTPFRELSGEELDEYVNRLKAIREHTGNSRK